MFTALTMTADNVFFKAQMETKIKPDRIGWLQRVTNQSRMP